MFHHYVKEDSSGDHWAAGNSGHHKMVLAQVQEDGNQARIQMTPEQARQFAAELIKQADIAELHPGLPGY